MSTLRSSSASREVCLRKHLLNKIFLQTLNHDDDLDDQNTPNPSSPAAFLFTPPNLVREQPAISEIAEQDIEMKDKENFLKNVGIFPWPTKRQIVSRDDENCVKSHMKNNDSQYNAFASATDSASLQDFSNLMVTRNIDSETEAASTETLETSVLAEQNIPKSSKRMPKKYSKILDRIEILERSVAVFCEKENKTPSAAFENRNSITKFQDIRSTQQKKQYEKYFKKTLKICNRLEGEISLYSQYTSTLERAVDSFPKGSKLYKMLEAKLKSAYKFHEEDLPHEELKTLMRQLKLVNLLLKKFESKTKQW